MSMLCCEDFGHTIGHLGLCLTILDFEYLLHDVLYSPGHFWLGL